MSSYLNIYSRNKKNKQRVLLLCYSRSSDMYQALYEHVTFVGNDEEEKYTILNQSTLVYIKESLREQLDNIKTRLELDEKVLFQSRLSDELLNELKDSILSSEEYIRDIEQTLGGIDVIDNLIYTLTEYNKEGEWEIVANYD